MARKKEDNPTDYLSVLRRKTLSALSLISFLLFVCLFFFFCILMLYSSDFYFILF